MPEGPLSSNMTAAAADSKPFRDRSSPLFWLEDNLGEHRNVEDRMLLANQLSNYWPLKTANLVDSRYRCSRKCTSAIPLNVHHE
jgi:hypothetical protein